MFRPSLIKKGNIVSHMRTNYYTSTPCQATSDLSLKPKRKQLIYLYNIIYVYNTKCIRTKRHATTGTVVEYTSWGQNSTSTCAKGHCVFLLVQ